LNNRQEWFGPCLFDYGARRTPIDRERTEHRTSIGTASTRSVQPSTDTRV
jgi:hypothetical protein